MKKKKDKNKKGKNIHVVVYISIGVWLVVTLKFIPGLLTKNKCSDESGNYKKETPTCKAVHRGKSKSQEYRNSDSNRWTGRNNDLPNNFPVNHKSYFLGKVHFVWQNCVFLTDSQSVTHLIRLIKQNDHDQTCCTNQEKRPAFQSNEPTAYSAPDTEKLDNNLLSDGSSESIQVNTARGTLPINVSPSINFIDQAYLQQAE